MTDLAMGGNAPIASPEFELNIHLPQGSQIDVSALLLYPGGKVRSDGDMCFFNQPSIGAGAISLSAKDNIQSFTLNFANVDNEVEKIVVNATLENGEFSAVGDLKLTTSCGANMLVETAGRTEAALILCEIYNRNGQWKIRNVSQGFNGGLQALAEHFGVEVDVPASPEPVATQPSSTSGSVSSSAPDSVSGSAPVPTAAPGSTSSSVSDPTSSSSTNSDSGSTSGSTAPDLFNRLKQTAALAGSRLSTEASKFRNRSFMEAVVNGCVLVAAADGSIDATEKQKMAGYIERSDELKHFEIGEVIKVFQSAAAVYESDNVIGKACALEKIRKVKSNEEQARLLVRVVSAIGAADGDFDAQEKNMVSEIARELGLNPADFNV
ncbi:MAG: TerD family protein [Granulosicoccus sp.]